MVREAALAVVPLVAETVKDSRPIPDPLFPDLMVTQDALLDVVHWQPAEVVTLTLPVPPEELNDWVFGDMAKEHDGATGGI